MGTHSHFRWLDKQHPRWQEALNPPPDGPSEGDEGPCVLVMSSRCWLRRRGLSSLALPLLLLLLLPLLVSPSRADSPSLSPPPSSPSPADPTSADSTSAAQSAPYARLFPAGLVSPLFRDQRLSHYAFHHTGSQARLARLFAPPPATIVIVGVEWGTDAIALARAGYRVIGIEPLRHFVAHMTDVAAREGLDIRMVHAAAGATSGGEVTVNYENAGKAGVETVTAVTVDEVLEAEPGGAPATVAVLAVDIQGEEAAVVDGAKRALARGSVASVWVEAIACNERVRPLLATLDAQFTLFDYAPWGAPRGWSTATRGPPSSADAFVAGGFPMELAPWWTALCAVQRRVYQWLQTDVVGVRRDLLTNHVVRELVGHGEAVCVTKGVCRMREVVPRRTAAAAKLAYRGWLKGGHLVSRPVSGGGGGGWGSLWGGRGSGDMVRRIRRVPPSEGARRIDGKEL